MATLAASAVLGDKVIDKARLAKFREDVRVTVDLAVVEDRAALTKTAVVAEGDTGEVQQAIVSDASAVINRTVGVNCAAVVIGVVAVEGRIRDEGVAVEQMDGPARTVCHLIVGERGVFDGQAGAVMTANSATTVIISANTGWPCRCGISIRDGQILQCEQGDIIINFEDSGRPATAQGDEVTTVNSDALVNHLWTGESNGVRCSAAVKGYRSIGGCA